MDEIRVSIRGGQTAFRPRDTIEGSVNWNLTGQAKSVEIRLVWFTRGKGTPDISIVDSRSFQAPSAMGDAPFRFTLPEGPHSFSGKLISLIWAVEAVALPNRGREMASGRQEFVLSPDGLEIVLPEAPKEPSPLEQRFKARKEEYQRQRGQIP